jgi:hypothetical protein
MPARVRRGSEPMRDAAAMSRGIRAPRTEPRSSLVGGSGLRLGSSEPPRRVSRPDVSHVNGYLKS